MEMSLLVLTSQEQAASFLYIPTQPLETALPTLQLAVPMAPHWAVVTIVCLLQHFFWESCLLVLLAWWFFSSLLNIHPSLTLTFPLLRGAREWVHSPMQRWSEVVSIKCLPLSLSSYCSEARLSLNLKLLFAASLAGL